MTELQQNRDETASGARIGADVGGTFTDLICVGDDGRVAFTKVLSTPPAYDRAVVAAAAELAAGAPVASVVHGTTVATNAVLERRGARLALVTTEGFRDVLELRRMPMFGAMLQPGDVMHHRMAGGGGHGDPLARDPRAVARDVHDHKVSVAAARDSYGVVVGHDGELDLDATEALRRSVVP